MYVSSHSEVESIINDWFGFPDQITNFFHSDKISEGMLTLATKQGWLQKTTNETRFTFASSSPEFLFAFFGEGRQRMCRSYEILQQSKGRITVRTMMSITRDHWPYSSKGSIVDYFEIDSIRKNNRYVHSQTYRDTELWTYRTVDLYACRIWTNPKKSNHLFTHRILSSNSCFCFFFYCIIKSNSVVLGSSS